MQNLNHYAEIGASTFDRTSKIEYRTSNNPGLSTNGTDRAELCPELILNERTLKNNFR